MKSFLGKKSFLRPLCLLLICFFVIGQCSCEEILPPEETSGTLYWTFEMDPFEKTLHIMELQRDAEEELERYLNEYNSEWYKNNIELQFSLKNNNIIGISGSQYLGYCFFDKTPTCYYDSIVYLIFHVSAADSTEGETVTKSFYMVSKKEFYATHNPPKSFIEGTDKIEFPSFSVNGFTSLDSVIEMIKTERGQNDISSELHLDENMPYSSLDSSLAYNDKIVVLFQDSELVYAVFMKDGKPDYDSPVTISKDNLKPSVQKQAESGTILSMYYTGERLEGYPPKVYLPLSITYIGKIEKSEQQNLKKAGEDLFGFFPSN